MWVWLSVPGEIRELPSEGPFTPHQADWVWGHLRLRVFFFFFSLPLFFGKKEGNISEKCGTLI